MMRVLRPLLHKFSLLIILSCVAGCVSNAPPERDLSDPSFMERAEGRNDKDGGEDGIGGTGLNQPSLDPYQGWAKPKPPKATGCGGGQRSSCIGKRLK